MKQQETMSYDPSDRKTKPYPSHAEQFRDHHRGKAWIYNPWSGQIRDSRDIRSDVYGRLINND